MPINIIDHPASPECEGKQWFISDFGGLAHLASLVLLGRSGHAARILSGAQRSSATVPMQLKERLRGELFPPPGSDPWHRDGLLFEIICWIAARMSAGPDERISDPHLRATQQGADTIKVSFDETQRILALTTIYEYKCTDKARRHFK